MTWFAKIFSALAIFVLCLIGWGVYTFLLNREKAASIPVLKNLAVGGRMFAVEIADETSEHSKGLSGRQSLADDRGMLFVFEGLRTRSFWMSGMKFPLDLVWIQGNKVIGISENLPPAPEGSAEIYSSPEPVDKVLEINAGLVRKLGIQLEDAVRLE